MVFPAGRPDIRIRSVVLSNEVSVRVAEAGVPDAQPVLLVHGWGASIYMWRDWFAPLAASGYRVVGVDLPGHGFSDKPAGGEHYSLSALVGALRELITLEGLGGAHVVAQSMGGTIAVELATTNPQLVGRLILVNPACLGRIRHSRLLRLISPDFIDAFLPKLVARRIVGRAHRMVYGDPSRITEHDIDEYWAPSQYPAYTRAMRRLAHEFPWARLRVEPMVARLRAIESRVMVVLGTRDRLVLDSIPYVRRLQRAGSKIDVAIIDGGGHAVNEELPDEVIARISQFLDNPQTPG